MYHWCLFVHSFISHFNLAFHLDRCVTHSITFSTALLTLLRSLIYVEDTVTYSLVQSTGAICAKRREATTRCSR